MSPHRHGQRKAFHAQWAGPLLSFHSESSDFSVTQKEKTPSASFWFLRVWIFLSIFLDLRGEKVRCQKRWDIQRCLLSSIMSPVFGIRTKLVSNKMSTEISFKFRLKIFVFLFFFFFFNIVFFFLPFFYSFSSSSSSSSFFFFFSPAVPNCGFKMEVSEYQEMRLFSGFPIKKPD